MDPEFEIGRTRSSPSGSVLSRYGPYHNEASTTAQSFDKTQVVKQGYLKKKSPKGVKGIKAWQNRYFVLYGRELKYFVNEEAHKSNVPPKGVIQIACIEALALASDNRIHIGVQVQKRESDFRTFYLKAESIEEAQSWISSIQKVQESMVASGPVGKSPPMLSVALGFVIPNSSTITLDCLGCMTAKQLKTRILSLIKEWQLEVHGVEMEVEQRLLLTVEDNTSSYDRVWDEEDCLCDLDCWEPLRAGSAVGKVSFIRWDVEINLKQRHSLAAEISKEVNMILGYRINLESDETREAISFYQELDKSVEVPDSVQIPAEHTKDAWRSLKDLNAGEIVCRCFFPVDSMSLNLKCSAEETVTQFKARVYAAYTAAAGKVENDCAENYCLKVVGRAAYFIAKDGDDELRMGDYNFVSNAVESSTAIDVRLEKLKFKEKTEIEPLNPLTYKEKDYGYSDSTNLLMDYVSSIEKSARSIDLSDWNSICVWDVHIPVRIRVVEVCGLSFSDYPDKKFGPKGSVDFGKMKLYASLGLYFGSESLCFRGEQQTSSITFTSCAIWNEVLEFSINLADLPRESRICITLYAISEEQEKEKDGQGTPRKGQQAIPIGWVSMLVFGHNGEMKTGLVGLNMWPDGPANPIGAIPDNITREPFCPGVVFIELEEFGSPVIFPRTDPTGDAFQAASRIAATQHKEFDDFAMNLEKISTRKATVDAINLVYQNENDKELVDEIVNADPLTLPNKVHRLLIWSHRELLLKVPHALPKYLLSVPWNRREAVWETHRLLKIWSKLTPEAALELLGPKFPDSHVREYAVEHLKSIDDNDLKEYVLQLVQVVKHEPYHSSPVGRFLIGKALKNTTIGHYVFWHMKSEMHLPDVRERYGILLSSYLMLCGPMRSTLCNQNLAQQAFVRVAEDIKKIKDKDERLKVLRERLHDIIIPSSYSLPLNPRIVCGNLKVEKCKYMDSKKLPLWLVINNVDPVGKPVYIIFKAGDDLRQDMLTLQMMRIMDKLWKKKHLDLCMNVYDCVSTGNEIGMIEVVMNSETTSGIMKGAGGVAANFREDPIANWLKDCNPSGEEYKKAVDNFTRSCAGYCVATCVLGIGDRHNDNIMLKRDGSLFHIDFGHFLGNFKSKFGFKRERARFVLTPDFAYVMGGENSPGFRTFEDLCVKAFNILRKEAGLFINLFQLMISCGIPELQTAEDIGYLKESFLLDKDDEEAGSVFKGWIHESLRCKTTQINNAIHTMVH